MLAAIALRRTKIIRDRAVAVYPMADLDLAIAEEDRREIVFRKRVEQRLRAGMKVAMRAKDPSARSAAIEALLNREQRYAEMRTAAAGERVLAAAELQDLRTRSPQGAFWALGMRQRHTPDSVGPGMVVEGPPLEAAARRWFDGELIEIETKGGGRLSLTPNHPVLTVKGWVAARALDKGDDLIRHLAAGVTASAQDDIDDVPPVIEEIFGALSEVNPLARGVMPVRAEDFHGDGQHGYVEVVATYGALGERVEAAIAQQRQEGALVWNGVGLMQLGGEGRSAASAMTIAAIVLDSTQPHASGLQAPRQRGPGDSGATTQGEDRLATQVGLNHVGRCRFDLAADFYPEPFQGVNDRLASDPVVAAELQGGLAGPVATDEIIGIRRRPYAGHVYDLQTVGRWFTVDSLVVSNCVSMAGRFWPWVVLNEVHPLLHVGCGCRLFSYGDALAKGMMAATDVMSNQAALRLAAPVIQHVRDEKAEAERKYGPMAEDEAAATEELLIREALLDRGGDADALAAMPLSCDPLPAPLGVIAEAEEQTGAMVALFPDRKLSKKLALPGGDPPEQLHVTLAFLGKAADLDFDKARAAVEAWAKKTPPLSGELSGIGHFDLGRGEKVTYRSVDLPELPTPREGLIADLDKAGVPPRRDHGFSPRMTIDSRMRRPEVKKQPITFAEVTLAWGGERHPFPLRGGKKST